MISTTNTMSVLHGASEDEVNNAYRMVTGLKTVRQQRQTQEHMNTGTQQSEQLQD